MNAAFARPPRTTSPSAAQALVSLLEGPGVEARGEVVAEALASEPPAGLALLAPRLLELLAAPGFGRTAAPYGPLRAHVIDAVLRAGYPFALSLHPDDLVVLRQEVERSRSRRFELLVRRLGAGAILAGLVLSLAWVASGGLEPVDERPRPSQPSGPVTSATPRAVADPASFARFSAVDEDLFEARSDAEIARAALLALSVGDPVGDRPLWALSAAWERRHRETGEPHYLRLRDEALAAVGRAKKLAGLREQLGFLGGMSTFDEASAPRRGHELLAAQAAAELEAGQVGDAAEHSWSCAERYPDSTRCLALHIEARQRLGGSLTLPSGASRWIELQAAQSLLARRLAAERLRELAKESLARAKPAL